MSTDLNEQLTLVRSTLRKDLDSFGFIPTGVGIQLVAGQDQKLGFSLLIEAVYVQVFNGRDLEALRTYLQGSIQVKAGMDNYVIKSAFRVRDALALAKGDGKTALALLMADKGAEKEMIKLLLTTCINVSKEFGVPFDKPIKAQKEFNNSQKISPACSLVLLLLAFVLVSGVVLLVRWIFF